MRQTPSKKAFQFYAMWKGFSNDTIENMTVKKEAKYLVFIDFI